MATVATLLVLMGMDTKGLVSGAAKADATLAGVGGSATKFGAIADKAFLGLGVAAVAGVAVAIKAGSDLNEQINKSEEVFGDFAGGVLDFSKTTASAMGISETSALEAAGAFGAMFQAAGESEKASAGMSQTMVQLAADMASFNNQDPTDMLDRLRGGLAGMAKPLRQFGVFLSSAAVEQQALADGIWNGAGIMTDAQKVQARYNLILAQTAKQQGDFARTLGTSLPNQMRVFKAELEDTAAKLGTQLLPIALDVVKVFKSFVPVLGIVARNLGLVFGILIGWAALKFLPALLFNIALGLEAIGAGSIASGIGNAAGSLAALAGTGVGLAAVVDVVGAVYLGMKLVNHEAPTFAANLGLAAAEIVHAGGGLPVLNDNLAELRAKANMAEAGISSFSGSMEAARHQAIQTGERLSKMGKEIRDGIVKEIPGIIGSVVKLKDEFSISPGELVKISRTWAEIAKRIAHDLRVIGESDLKPAMREAIAALPPEMRDAWVRGTEQQRHAIEASTKKALSIQDLIPGLAHDALTGSTRIGKTIPDGMAQGIDAEQGVVAAAGVRMVNNALAAMRRAAAAESPSKKAEELGHDMISGLVNGLLKNQNALLSAAEKVMTALQDKLSSLVSKAQGFGQGISGGFSSLLSFPTEEGTNVQAAFAQQLGQAQQMRDVLQALKTQGAGKGLLSEIASQGPAAIPMAQTLLQGGPQAVAEVNKAYNDIASIASKTADSLTNQFFGDRIDSLRKDVKDEKDVLVDIKQNVRFLEKISNQLSDSGSNITVNINGDVTGEEIVKKVRDGLIKLGNRNAGTGL